MKNLIYVLAILLLASCSSTQMVDSWRSKNYDNYQPKKILIVGLTENLTARKLFEAQLKSELQNRGIEAVESYDVFSPVFTSTKQTEEAIKKEIESISKEGFDAILVSAVKGVNEKTTYSGDNIRTGYYWRPFGRYYYLYQDVYFVEGYYNTYNVYNIESSLYNLKENNDKSLVWVASYAIVDPKKISATVSRYVEAIIKALEKEQLIKAQ